MRKFYKRIAQVLVLTTMFSIVPDSISLGNKVKAESLSEKELIPSSSEIIANTAKAKQPKKIISEVLEKRESNIKHFLNEDSTFSAVVYENPVHFLKDGKLKDIDNSLVESTDETFLIDGQATEKNILQNKENDY